DRFYNRPRNAFNFTGFSREVELETAALAWRRVDHDLASTLGDAAVHGCQPQTGPASPRLGRDEGFEHAPVCPGRHAFARVANGDADVVAAYDVRVCRTVVCSEGVMAGFDREFTSRRHRVARVAHQVDDHLLDACFVEPCVSELRIETQIEMNVRRND